MGFGDTVSTLAGTGIDGTGSSARNGRDWPKRPELSEIEAGMGFKMFCTVLVTGTRRFGRSGWYRNGTDNYGRNRPNGPAHALQVASLLDRSRPSQAHLIPSPSPFYPIFRAPCYLVKFIANSS